MRTALYIDGFNLFYGALKQAPPGYRWLDLHALGATVLQPQHQITEIHYCTALVRPLHDGDPCAARQKIYLKALQAYLPHCTVHHGHFLVHPATAPNADPPPSYVRYMKTEEKGSDVNLATRLVADAFLDRYDCAVVISNDGDMAPAVRIARQEADKVVGVLAPREHPARSKQRRVSAELRREATFVRSIRPNAIAGSQLPSPIPGTRLYKPTNW